MLTYNVTITALCRSFPFKPVHPPVYKHPTITKCMTPWSTIKHYNFKHLYLELSSWSMLACNLANQEKNCKTNWHHVTAVHLLMVQGVWVWLATAVVTSDDSHLLCSFYPLSVHIEHLETLEQDVLCWSRHSRCERRLQGPWWKATQVFNGELQNQTGLQGWNRLYFYANLIAWRGGVQV